MAGVSRKSHVADCWRVIGSVYVMAIRGRLWLMGFIGSSNLWGKALIALRETLQEPPRFHGKIHGFL